MAERLNKTQRVAETVSSLQTSNDDRTFLLCNLLWEIAQGTRWQDDAESGIVAVCPEFFDRINIEEFM